MVLVLEGQFSHSQKADHWKNKFARKEGFWNPGKVCWAFMWARNICGGIGKSTFLRLVHDWYFWTAEVTGKEVHTLFRCQPGPFHLIQTNTFYFLSHTLAKAALCLQNKIQKLYFGIHGYWYFSLKLFSWFIFHFHTLVFRCFCCI